MDLGLILTCPTRTGIGKCPVISYSITIFSFSDGACAQTIISGHSSRFCHQTTISSRPRPERLAFWLLFILLPVGLLLFATSSFTEVRMREQAIETVQLGSASSRDMPAGCPEVHPVQKRGARRSLHMPVRGAGVPTCARHRKSADRRGGAGLVCAACEADLRAEIQGALVQPGMPLGYYSAKTSSYT